MSSNHSHPSEGVGRSASGRQRYAVRSVVEAQDSTKIWREVGAQVSVHQPTAKPANIETAYGYVGFRGSGFGNLLSTRPTLNQRTNPSDRGTYLIMLHRTKR